MVGVAVVVPLLVVRNDETVDWIGIFISVLSWQVTMREWGVNSKGRVALYTATSWMSVLLATDI